MNRINSFFICIFNFHLFFFVFITPVTTTDRYYYDKYTTINTDSGPICGKLETTLFDKKFYYSFKGIPYAEPPKYGLRFLPPKPIKPWIEPRNCFEYGSVCLQFNPINETEPIGNEDCLFLNIYTPADYYCKTDKLRTVMVYIHGGGFGFGSGDDDLQGPDFLINDNVILVTLNYRLGVMGFLSLGTPHYSGNQGLKDQQLALKWINRNIGKFGGNPKEITIFGQSAGSASCEFHMLAPGSQGLFKRAIEMSFTFDIWAVFEKGDHLEEMYNFACKQQYFPNNYGELVHFLHTVDPMVILTSFPIVHFHSDRSPISITSKWLPVIENSRAIEPFMQFTPSQYMIMENFTYCSKVDVLTGYTTSESLFVNAKLATNPKLLNFFDKNFAIELPSMYFTQAYNSLEFRSAMERVRNYYFPNGVAINQNNETIANFVKLMDHVYEVFQIDKRVKLRAQQSMGRTFYYRFGLVSQMNYYKNLLGAENLAGAAHADDLCYIFHCGHKPEMYQNITRGSFDLGMIRMMTGLFTNFAKFGTPLPNSYPNFKPVQVNQIHFLDITNNGLIVGENPYRESINFWSKLLLDHPKLLTHNVDQHLNRIINQLMKIYL